jgi:hypothetical protein
MTGGEIRFDLAKHAEERSINVFTKRPLDSKLSLSESRQKATELLAEEARIGHVP